jgi:D-3-phosphoglycerate dehydrogenase
MHADYNGLVNCTVMFEILTLNAISPRGLARLPKDRYRVSSDAATPRCRHCPFIQPARIVRFPPAFRAIGRAGAGVNNIPVAAMSARGIPVFNAPGANANAVKELVIAGLIVGCRHLCHAWEFGRGLTGSDAELHKACRGRQEGVRRHGNLQPHHWRRGARRDRAATWPTPPPRSACTFVGFDPGLTLESANELSPAIPPRGIA